MIERFEEEAYLDQLRIDVFVELALPRRAVAVEVVGAARFVVC